MGYYNDGGWPAYVSVAERKRRAERKLAALRRHGQVCQPVQIEGRAIARTFWGKAWCQNLEAYSDYANRLPRGRSYVRNDALVDLRIGGGRVTAQVMGSDLYRVEIDITPVASSRWQSIINVCAGQIGSLIELLQGKFSKAVMQIVTDKTQGLFPAPREIRFRCSCPDSASLCKHVATALYGVGARLDHDPGLLFALREVDPQALIAQATQSSILAATALAPEHTRLEGSDLSQLFGIDLGESPSKPNASNVASPKPNTAPRGKRETSGGSEIPLTGSAASKNKRVVASRKQVKTITARELAALGIAAHVRQRWIKAGILVRTDVRGVYRITAQTNRAIAQYQALHQEAINRSAPRRTRKST